MNNDRFNKSVNKLYKIAFPNGNVDFIDMVWKLSQGNRAEAFYIIKQLGYKYNIEVTDKLFDHVNAKACNGQMVEWVEQEWKEVLIDTPWIVKGNQRVKVEALKAIDRYFENKRK